MPVAFTALLLGSAMSHAECNRPENPTLPDGSTATKEQMIEGH